MSAFITFTPDADWRGAQDFREQSSLLAPPLIAQTRARLTEQCPTNYSSTFIRNQHAKAVRQKCAAPFTCPPEVLVNATYVLGCKEQTEERPEYFGLEASASGRYRDFLYSLASQEGFLFRGGQVVPTSEFLDRATQTVELVLVFFTPQRGLVTILNVSADLSGEDDIAVSTAVEHIGMLEGSKLHLVGVRARTHVCVCACVCAPFVWGNVVYIRIGDRSLCWVSGGANPRALQGYLSGVG